MKALQRKLNLRLLPCAHDVHECTIIFNANMVHNKGTLRSLKFRLHLMLGPPFQSKSLTLHRAIKKKPLLYTASKVKHHIYFC